MDGHVWRVPMLQGVMACSALVLFAAAVMGAVLVGRAPRPAIARIAAGAVLGLLALLGGVALRATAASIARTYGVSITYVDPGPIGYAAPVMFAGFALVVARRMLGDAWTSPAALRFYAWVVGFTAANAVNWCQPGWCQTVGFPFAWQRWSDAVFNDGTFDRIMEVAGAVLNVATFVAVAHILTRTRTRVHQRPV